MRQSGIFQVRSQTWQLTLHSLLVILLICFVIDVARIALEDKSTQYFRKATYVYVEIKAGDTVWNVAANHVSHSEDIRDLVYAIKAVNNLHENAAIYPGQVLKVPLLSGAGEQ